MTDEDIELLKQCMAEQGLAVTITPQGDGKTRVDVVDFTPPPQVTD